MLLVGRSSTNFELVCSHQPPFSSSYIGIGKMSYFSRARPLRLNLPTKLRDRGKRGSTGDNFDLVATAHQHTGLSIANLMLDNQQFVWYWYFAAALGC